MIAAPLASVRSRFVISSVTTREKLASIKTVHDTSISPGNHDTTRTTDTDHRRYGHGPRQADVLSVRFKQADDERMTSG